MTKRRTPRQPGAPKAHTVRVTTSARMITPEFHPFVTTVLIYDPRDPWAVTMAFPGGRDSDGGWKFARDLLAAGIDEPAGYGDVRVWPAGNRVAVILDGPNGRAQLELRRADVSRFLDRAYHSVPPGTEQDHVDLDQVVSRLLTAA